MGTPTLIVKIAFTAEPLKSLGDIDDDTGSVSDSLTNGGWVDVTSYVRGKPSDVLSIKRGRRNELSEIESGEATVVLNNYDRRFDSMDSTSPYYPHVKTMNRIRIGATWDDGGGPDTYWLFTGYVERWELFYPNSSSEATATLTCVDGTKYLNLSELTDFTRSQEGSGTRVDAILDDVDWPIGDRSIAVGDIDVRTEIITKQSALHTLRLIAAAERGLFFFSGSGNPTFQDRSLRNTLTTSGLWTDAVGGSDPSYDTFITRNDDANIWNEIHVTRTDGIEQIASDSTSIDAYFRRALPFENLPLVDDTDALDMAQWTLAQLKDARVRPDQLDQDPAAHDQWGLVLAREISDVISIDQRVLTITDTSGATVIGGFTSSFAAHIEGIQWRISKGVWRVTWLLSPNFTIVPDTGTLNTTDDWIVLTLDPFGGWSNSSSVLASYRKDADGWVSLRGRVGGGAVYGSLIGSLPVGYRPAMDMNFATTADTAFGALHLRRLDGGFGLMAGGGTDEVDLAAIRFRVI